MKLLIAISAIIVAAECASLIEVNCYNFDAATSCSSLQVAKKCGFVTECIETVWQQRVHDENTNDVCQFCESIITDIRGKLNNQTLEMVIDYLNAACQMIPEQAIADDCRAEVDEYASEIYQMIQAALDPQTVCATIGLCDGFSRKEIAPKEEVNPIRSAILLRGAPIALPVPVALVTRVHTANGDVCADCKTFIQDLKDMVSSEATEKELEDYLKQMVCASLGTMEQECDDLVASYIPEIVTLLESEVSPELICQSLDVCPGAINHSYLTKMKLQKTPLYAAARQSVHGSEECEMCTLVMTELQNLDRDATVQAGIKAFLKNELCANLGSYKDTCDETVDTYGAIVFELLASELDPTTRCQSLGFCPAELDATRDATPASRPISRPARPVHQSTQCILCEFIMKEIDDMLQENTTEAEVIASLDKVCSLLPDTIKEECMTFVETYGPSIITLLLAELSPDVICATLGLCSEAGAVLKYQPVVALSARVGGDEACGVCETIIQYVDSLLQENSTVELIENTLDKVCNFMPETFKADCDDFIQTYGPAVIEIILEEASPEAVCTSLGLCTQRVPMMNLIEARTAPLLGANECTWGPSYWCESRDNAERCQAVAHCDKHGWR